MSSLFAPWSSFLEQALNEYSLREARSAVLSENYSAPRSSAARLNLLDIGILELVPEDYAKDSRPAENKSEGGLVLSAGIHGNETAPIELINLLIESVLAGETKISRPTLVILGHPLAMQRAERFVEFNMNRLFTGQHLREDFVHSVDAKRAKQLEEVLTGFASNFGIASHYDLHTAIRDSKIERFALKPFVNSKNKHSVSSNARNTLEGFGVEALVYQHKRATTFSSHTAQSYGSESFTLELGKVHAFGENDLAAYSDALATIKALVSNSANEVKCSEMQEFVVCHETLVDDKDFKLHIADSAANFTQYIKGTTINSSSSSSYCVVNNAEYIIFPNAKVPLGQRAGLMLKRIDCRQTK